MRIRVRFTAVFAWMVLAAAGQAQQAKLIEWGWDEPTTSDLRANIARMEQAPFDGVVLSAIGWKNGTRIDLSRQSWGRQAFTQQQFTDAVSDLKATRFRRFTDNFLRFNVTPGDVDWFDDAGWKAVRNNAALAAWICREGKLKGLMFDTEQYEDGPFDYASRANAGRYSFAQYAAKARQRGREMAEAMSIQKPDLVLMFTFGPSYTVLNNISLLPDSIFSLLPAFLDGLMDGANANTVFIDGLEWAYGNRTRREYNDMRQAVMAAANYSVSPARYTRRMRVSFGFWLDALWQETGWDPIHTRDNYYTPVQLRDALRVALTATDRYVWFYSENINWWTGEGISPAYLNAIKAAR